MCPECGYHGRLTASQRLDQLLDGGSAVAPPSRAWTRALSEFDVAGRDVRTTTPLLRSVLGNQKFRPGAHTTSLLEQMSHIQGPAS